MESDRHDGLLFAESSGSAGSDGCDGRGESIESAGCGEHGVVAGEAAAAVGADGADGAGVSAPAAESADAGGPAEDAAPSAFVVDRCEVDDAGGHVSLAELSCGHTVQACAVAAGNCPKCGARIERAPRGKGFAWTVAFVSAACVAVLLAIALFRPVSFREITSGAVDRVNPAQASQLAGFEAMSYRTKGFTWLLATCTGRWPHYDAAAFGLSPSGTQTFYDSAGEPVFYLSTGDDMGGCVAVTLADGGGKATLHALW